MASVQIIEGSTVLQVAGPTLFEAAPEEFRRARLSPEVDPGRPAIDSLIEALDAAVDGEDRSALYDGQLLEFLRKLDSVFAHGVNDISFESANGAAQRPSRVVHANLRRFRELESRIPRPQHVRVAGKLDTIRHSDMEGSRAEIAATPGRSRRGADALPCAAAGRSGGARRCESEDAPTLR